MTFYMTEHTPRRGADYDLVRIYHPDSPHCRIVPPAERRMRFQAIAAAYDALRGKAVFENGRTHRSPADDPFEEELARRRGAYWAHPSRQPGYAERPAHRRADDTHKEETTINDKIVILLGALVFNPFFGFKRTWRLLLDLRFQSLFVGIVPGAIAFPAYADKRHKAAAANLKRARSDAREHGNARMAEIRKRVQEIKT